MWPPDRHPYQMLFDTGWRIALDALFNTDLSFFTLI